MADILSQEELDALLGQMKDETGDGDDDDAPVRIDPDPPLPERPRAAAPEEEAPAPQGDEERNVEIILNIPVQLAVELGRTRMTVHELLQLGQGSVIELNRLASDLIDLTINRRVVAQGEAVVINENFGFRVLEVDSVRDRIRKL